MPVNFVVGGDDSGWLESSQAAYDTLKKLGVASDQPQVDKIVVDKSDGILRAYDPKVLKFGDGQIIKLFSD